VAPVAGQPVQTTLDARVQEAADNAVAGTTSPSALVAVDVATGDVLAVAVGPDAGGYDTALLGQYSPGSTFKIVTTLALLRHGLSVNEPVACPEFATVDGKTFHNYNHEVLGTVPFHRDFAQSCNTAFIGLSSRLGPSDLAQAAASLGVGVPWSLGTPAFSGNVPTGETGVNLAADSFGQGQVTVSPLAMAVAAASIAHGGTVTPHLVLSPNPTGTTGGTASAATSGSPSASASPMTASPVEPAQAATIASLMREVVTSGTGTVLAGLPGGPVAAKTGTAEYGTDNPPKTHAWMVGYQGGIAFAAFVHDGATGAGTAGPIVESFLRALAAD
jgi:cell division protein FtsI/penicillin-binding protein 2